MNERVQRSTDMKHATTPRWLRLYVNEIRKHHNTDEIKDLIKSIGVRGTGMLLALIANILIARLLGPIDFGRYMTLLSAALLAGGLAAFGCGPLLMKEVAIRLHSAQPVLDTVVVIRWTVRITAILAMVAMAAFVTWLLLAWGAPKTDWLERSLSAAVIPISIWATLATGILGGMGLVPKSQSIQFFWKNGLLLFGICLVLLVVSAHDDVSILLLLQCLSYLGATLIGIVWIVQRYSNLTTEHSFSSHTHGATVHAPLQNKLLRTTGYLFAGSIALVLLDKVDVVVVNGIGGPAIAGQFAAAVRIAQIVGIPGIVWLAWLQPRVAYLATHDHKQKLLTLLRISTGGIFGITVISSLFCWLLAPQLMSLLGTGFTEAVTPFRLLLLGYIIWSVSVPYYVFLTMSGREKIAARILWVQVLLTVMLCFPFVKLFGVIGGAVAWSIGLVVSSLMIITAGVVELRGTQSVVDG